PGVQILIEQTEQGTVTDPDGYYDILNVKPGTYTVIFRFLGFAVTRVEEVKVIVDKTTTVDVRMQEEVIEGAEILVVAERTLIQVDRTTTTSFVDQEKLEALPVTGIGEVIDLQAGVVDGHFRGGRIGEVSYLVNGISIINPINNQAAFEVEKNMVAGLEVISGVFNAEYGQAMSGVVNILTRDVPSRWSGSLSGELGATASGREIEFLGRTAEPGNNLRATDFRSVMVPYHEASGFPARKDVQFSLGGPLVRERIGLQFGGRYFYNEGTVIGRRLFAPSDSSQNLNSGNPQTWIIESTGDQEFVPHDHERYSFNGKLTYRLSNSLKSEYEFVYQENSGWNLNFANYHERKYVPDGANRYSNRSQFHLVALRLTPGATSFAGLNYSYLRDRGSSQLYDVPDNFDETGLLDPRYVSPELDQLVGANAFSVGGNDLFNSRDVTETHTILGDYTVQFNRINELKAGFSARLHKIHQANHGIEVSSRTGFRPMPVVDEFGRDTLRTSPYELAAYVQDKMEYRNLVLNFGLRFDYFEPDYLIPIDWTQANDLYIPVYNDAGGATGDSLFNREEAPARYQLSPRVGIGFPISASGAIRFSAGLFFQTPPLNLLYENSEYEVNPQDNSTTFGNPAIDPERTLHFEIGLQQALTNALGLELTLFSKDIRNLTGVEIQRDVATTNFFVRYINRDVGTSRGVTISLFQRPIGPISWNVDYTLQFADGTSSDPNEAFDRFQAGQEEILTLVRLDWDRRHVLNNSITYAPWQWLSMTMVNRYQSGTPYTTERNFIVSYIENNGDRPSNYMADLRLGLTPPFLADNLSFTLQIDNLFDSRAHTGVYNDSGRSDESLSMELFRRSGAQVGGLNTLEDYFVEQWRFSAPRRVYFGMRYNL
ncbi:MAG TPA: TonB-dependent receptor, partial [Rhodothermales bacterium]|nr:TonB-dependent receptor [Rhodothermales bacterium]